MNENGLYIVKEYIFDNPIITKKGSIINSCYRDCRNKNFHTFINDGIFDIKLTNTRNIEINIITISDKTKNLYELNKKLTVARQNGFKFNRINKLRMKIYSHLRYINISCYLKFQIPMCHRQYFRKTSQNREYINNFCNDMENPFHFACRHW